MAPAFTKITVTIEPDQLSAIRRLIDSGDVANVSAFVRHAIDVALHDEADFDALIQAMLAETGGPLTAEETARADKILGVA